MEEADKTSLPGPWTALLQDDAATEIVIRRLVESDRVAYLAAVDKLSLETFRLRFLSPRRRLGQGYVDQIFDTALEGRETLVALHPTADEIIGVGRAEPIHTAEAPEGIEIAVTVSDDWQGRGLGAALLDLLIRLVWTGTAQRICATTEASNEPIRHLLRSRAFMTVGTSRGVTEWRLERPRPLISR